MNGTIIDTAVWNVAEDDEGDAVLTRKADGAYVVIKSGQEVEILRDLLASLHNSVLINEYLNSYENGLKFPETPLSRLDPLAVLERQQVFLRDHRRALNKYIIEAQAALTDMKSRKERIVAEEAYLHNYLQSLKSR